MNSFIEACKNDNLKLAKEIYTHQDINYHTYDDEAFRRVCENGKLDIAKWLLFLDNKLHNEVPGNLLNKVCKVNIFESTQVDLIKMYTKLIIS